jgi:hypothetical protein
VVSATKRAPRCVSSPFNGSPRRCAPTTATRTKPAQARFAAIDAPVDAAADAAATAPSA